MSLPQATVPPQVDQLVVEDVEWVFDCTQLLAGETIGAVTSSTLTTDGTPVTLVDAATFTGVFVTQRIRPGVLTGGALYRLVVLINPAGSTNELASILQISCPF